MFKSLILKPNKLPNAKGQGTDGLKTCPLVGRNFDVIIMAPPAD